MRYRVSLAILLLAACGPLPAKVADNECHSASQKSYAGVVLAMSTGDATFATSNPHCAYVFNANEEFYDRIFEAWSASPYGDYFRPVYVDVEGDFDPNSDPDKPQVFHVETVRSVTINFTEAQAKRAFELRMGPRSWQRTKERSEQPANGRASPTPFL